MKARTELGAANVPVRDRLWTLAYARAAAIRIGSTELLLGVILLVGLALRLAWVLHLDTFPLGGDTSWYFNVGTNLTNGNGFVADHELYSDNPVIGQPTAFWPPAYPFALAGIWKVFGVSLTSAKVFNAVVGALTILPVFALGRAIWKPRIGLLAAGLYAVFPNAIAWLPMLFPEAMFTLLITTALWVLVAFRPERSRSWLPAVLALGVLTGLAALSRGQGLVLVPVALTFWLSRDGWRAALRHTGPLVLAVALVIGPWTIRNWVVMGSPILIASSSGMNLAIGHSEDANGTFVTLTEPVDGIEMGEANQRPEWEVKTYRVYTQRALEYAVTHPWRELGLAKDKIYYLYTSDSGAIDGLTTLGSTPIRPQALEDALPRVMDYAYYALVFAAVATTPFCLRRAPNRLLLLNVVVWWTLFHIAFQGQPRYHLPLYPLFAIAAVAGLREALKTARMVVRPPRRQ